MAPERKEDIRAYAQEIKKQFPLIWAAAKVDVDCSDYDEIFTAVFVGCGGSDIILDYVGQVLDEEFKK